MVIFSNYVILGESRGHGKNNGTNALGLQERETPHLHTKPQRIRLIGQLYYKSNILSFIGDVGLNHSHLKPTTMLKGYNATVAGIEKHFVLNSISQNNSYLFKFYYDMASI